LKHNREQRDCLQGLESGPRCPGQDALDF
jgi:hypothetical protein